ncbi:MAG: SDR family NAD(P)-dependent oxidoreductase [Candidatus Hydrogenedentes bacterium]|nr:SDR family NAD(P)-dependent oxidoreductase [Candidatus Hydrogenedentota bacterium]
MMADRRFFLTGCASGMGRRLTTTLAQQGHRVYATDLNADALEKTAEECGWPDDRVRCAALDVRDQSQWKQRFSEAVADFGHIDVTMNIAGVLQAAWADSTPEEYVHLQLDVNVKGVIFGTATAASHMVARGTGHIINIASIAGLVPVPGLSVYAASKAACRSYSIAAALELRPKGVFVTAVCPAAVQTPMLDRQVHNEAAEMFFSGARILTLADIEAAVLERALVRRPLVVHVPRSKAQLARFADWFPQVAPLMLPYYRWTGRKRLAQRRQE